MSEPSIYPSARSSGPKIEIQPMIQQSSRSKVDDWSGVSDPKVRRRLQNRLNQRAYRSRQEVNTRGEGQGTNKKRAQFGAPADRSQCTSSMPASSQTISETPRPIRGQVAHWTWAPSNLRELMKQFECRAMKSYLGGSPQVDHLISLSRLNVWHAANANIAAVGMSTEHLWADESMSIFCALSADHIKDTVPSSLRPTALQRTVPHHPWFDVFPFPAMRDNFIQRINDLDDEDLCHDLVGFWDTRRTDATLLVWGLPWDPSKWEVTEAFARKWSWTLRGCPEIFQSTNYWRARRGEKALVWRHVLFST